MMSNQSSCVRAIGRATAALLLGLFAGCGEQDLLPGDTGDGSGATIDGDDSANPLDGYVPDPEVYVAPTDSARLIEVTSAAGTVSRFPSNQLLVLLNEGVPRATAERLAGEVGGRIVGQIPGDGFYQIELSTSTLAELDAAIAHLQADSDVTAAGRSLMGELAQSCPADDDNGELQDMDRCAFTATEYYQAITMFEFFRPHVTLHRVVVGIIDTGVDVTTGEFTPSRILNLNEIDAQPIDWDPEGHGTAVAGIIGAEDTGRGINGLAWRFLRNNLWLAVSTMGEDLNVQPQICIASAVVLANAGASVINCSFGWPQSDRDFDVIRETWRRIIRRRSNVLFVAAAGNERTELTDRNYAPGGLDLPNLITVAGSALCNPQELYANSNRGGFDVAAPAESVPATSRDGSFRLLNGTSIAAPQVTALAAVLKSLRPALSAAELKHYIVAYALSAGSGATFARLCFSTSIGELLLAMDVPDPVASWIDPLGLGNYGASGLILSRLCPAGISFQVEGYGNWDLFEPGREASLGVIGSRAAPPTVSLAGTEPDEVRCVISSDTIAQFALGSYVIADSGPEVVRVLFMDEASVDMGLGIAGSINFDACSIYERDPFDGITPWIVRVSGDFEGVLEVAHVDGRDPTLHEISGYFTLPMLTVFTGPDDPLRDYLEITCEGGMPRGE